MAAHPRYEVGFGTNRRVYTCTQCEYGTCELKIKGLIHPVNCPHGFKCVQFNRVSTR
jgi:hypothetical protein